MLDTLEVRVHGSLRVQDVNRIIGLIGDPCKPMTVHRGLACSTYGYDLGM